MAHERLHPCSVCGQCEADGFARFYAGAITLWRCRACGYVSPGIGPGNWQPPEHLAGESAAEFAAAENGWRYPHRARILRNTAKEIVHQLNASTSPPPARRLATSPRGRGVRLLDVGCGDGHFLAIAREVGLDPVGIEAEPALADYAARQSACEIIAGRDAVPAMTSLPAESVQAVTFIHSLEHLPNPYDALLAVRRILQPGGLLVIDLPSIRSPHWLAWRATGCSRFIDNAWGVIDEHVGYYTPRSLTYLTRRTGFRTLRLTTGRWRYKYSGLARLAAYALDPLLNALRIGGIFYIGVRNRDDEPVK